jgi:hypothetical protein
LGTHWLLLLQAPIVFCLAVRVTGDEEGDKVGVGLSLSWLSGSGQPVRIGMRSRVRGRSFLNFMVSI